MRRYYLVMFALLAHLLFVHPPAVCAQDKDSDGKEVVKKLKDHLALKHAGRESDQAMTDLVGELAKLKYNPAKREVYATVFYWFGFDDTMTAHPDLFKVKEKLEKETAKRVRYCQ